MSNNLRIRDIKELVRKSKRGSVHWFDKGTMRFFNSRVPSDNTRLINNEYFISSEKFDYNSPREYSIRRFKGKDKQIDTIGEFRAFKSRPQAMKKLKELLRN